MCSGFAQKQAEKSSGFAALRNVSDNAGLWHTIALSLRIEMEETCGDELVHKQMHG